MFENKSILVTGGTGSFGKTFSRMLLSKYNIKKLIIFSRDEYKQFILHKQLLQEFGDEKMSRVRFFIATVILSYSDIYAIVSTHLTIDPPTPQRRE